MRHGKWANVLFVHWAVPPDLEPLLLDGLNGNDESSRFELDKYMRPSPDNDICHDNANTSDRNANKDGKYTADSRTYVGLVLLIDHNVGLTMERDFDRLLVTHHGANLRAYVRPTRGCNGDDTDDDYWNAS